MPNFVDFVANDELIEPLRDEEGTYDEIKVNIGQDQEDEKDFGIEEDINDDEEDEFDFDNDSKNDNEDVQLDRLLDDEEDDDDNNDD